MSKFTPVTIRKAAVADVPAIVGLFLEDVLGRTRESVPVPGDGYYQAFAAIDSDPHQELLVLEQAGEVIATLQLTFTPNMTLHGAWRCFVEGVHVKSTHRGQGIGHWLFEQVFIRAKARRCQFIQLTSNKVRTKAAAFYESLGFTASHVGFKKILE